MGDAEREAMEEHDERELLRHNTERRIRSMEHGSAAGRYEQGRNGRRVQHETLEEAEYALENT